MLASPVFQYASGVANTTPDVSFCFQSCSLLVAHSTSSSPSRFIWFMYFIMMTPLIIIPTIMLPNAIRIASKSRLYIVAALLMFARTSIEQLIVPALILYGVSQIKEE